MPAKPVRVIVSLDRADAATPAIFGGILAVARRRGWRLLGPSATQADGWIGDPARPAGMVTERGVTISADPFGNADVRPDAAAVGRMAAEHFLARGFRRFHSICPPGDPCGDAFAAAAGNAGGSCSFGTDLGGLDPGGKPVACLAKSDAEASRWISDARAAGWSVPADLAVLSVGNDVMDCECAAIAISSIDVGPARLGRAAAERLHRLMRGRDVPAVEYLPPVAVVERESTDTLAVDDFEVATAVRFIREHAAGPLRVGDVLRASGIDRRTLERRFAKHFVRSPAEAIRRTRVEIASKLLRETTLPMTEVARASGFRLPQYLAVAFKAIAGQTPTDYRASMTGDTP